MRVQKALIFLKTLDEYPWFRLLVIIVISVLGIWTGNHNWQP